MGSPGENTVAYWKKQITLADERVEDWLKDAKRITQLYEAQKDEKNAFNILYANTETLLPALFNSLPRPVAQRRFKDADPVSRAVSTTITRSLTYFIDSPDAEYEPFFNVIRDAVISALVPGLGVTWFRYDFETESLTSQKDAGRPAMGRNAEQSEDRDPDLQEEIVKEGDESDSGDPSDDNDFPDDSHNAPQVSYEAVCAQNVPYHMVRWGYARNWSNVPWVARLHIMTKSDVRREFGNKLAEKIEYDDPKSDADSEDAGSSRQGDPNDEANEGSGKVCEVWEVWHKATGKVLFVCLSYKDGPLAMRPDPLGLTGFFPCPEFLQFTQKVSSLVPTPLYKYYEQQAGELNNISIRIKRVIAAIKVRGFYNGQLADALGKLLETDDNTLLPAQVAALFEGKDLANQIWLMPLQELAATLQQLIQQRQQIKQTIYEITGISDILRGSTVASETATAQNIKNQWGTLRLKRSQKKVQDYVKSCMRIMTEIIGQKFSPQTFAQITNLPYIMPEQKQQAQAAIPMLAQIVQRQQAMQQPGGMGAPANGPGLAPVSPGMGPPPPGPPPGGPPPPGPPGPPGGPPGPPPGGPPPPGPQGPPPPGAPPGGPPPPPSPEQQQLQQLQQLQSQIDWGQVVAIMRSNVMRGFKVDIETNSTIDADATEDQKNISEFLMALGQAMQAFGPMLQMGAITQPMFKSMMTAIARRFEFGAEVEDAITEMPEQLPPPPPDPSIQKAQVDMQQTQAEGQIKLQTMQMQTQADKVAAQAKMQDTARKSQYEGQKHQMMMRKLARDEQMAEAEHQRKMQEMALQAQIAAMGPPTPAGPPRKGNGRTR